MGDNNDYISRYFYESITTKLERTIEKLWLTVILLILLLVGTNAAWIYYESQFEDTVTTVSQDVDAVSGNAAIFDGVHINDGTGETDSNN